MYGLNSLKRRLLAEKKLTLKTAMDLAKRLESAEVETKLMDSDIKTEKSLPLIKKQEKVIAVIQKSNLQIHTTLKL